MNSLDRKITFGQIGGGQGSFIGAVHRRAAIADGKTELAAGAFSSDPERARASGRELLIADERNYGSWQAMLERESALPAGERIDFVNIVTPNHVHFEPALAFAQAGIHVVMDKPMVHSSEQAQALIEAVEENDIIFCLTHNYTGYPMVKEARDLVRSGRLGEIRRVVTEYPQGWLAEKEEDGENKQAAWRTDPTRSGIAGAVGDIGSHCENLMSYITGLTLDSLCADVTTFVPGRLLDDDASVLLRFTNGAKGVLWCSQIATAEENDINIRVYGTKGSLEWHQEHPNWLYFKDPHGPTQIYKRGNPYLSAAAQHATHLPAGHPEAFYEAFANLYQNVTNTIRARLLGQAPDELDLDFPTVYDGAQGVKFIEKVIESGRQGAQWVTW
ncbi:MAG: Gfo/Idh/MocA family oxidoreductase [Caldilineaceae bacterium]|nr:Gfo/Idh/MocA family oxidoreductase [Caldilineaceae bacterium]